MTMHQNTTAKAGGWISFCQAVATGNGGKAPSAPISRSIKKGSSRDAITNR